MKTFRTSVVICASSESANALSDIKTKGGKRDSTSVRRASAGGRSQVSSNGGRYVRWSADGTGLFYLTRSGTLMRVAVDSEGPVFGFQTAEPLFDARMSTAILDSVMTPYDVSSDGRFLMTVGSAGDMPAPIHLFFNWLLLNWRPDD